MTLPRVQKVTGFDKSQVTNLNESLEQIERSAISVQYGTAVPTLLDYGVIYIRDTGSTRALYIKTGKGTIVAITAT
jgi:hypothetical protein